VGVEGRIIWWGKSLVTAANGGKFSKRVGGGELGISVKAIWGVVWEDMCFPTKALGFEEGCQHRGN